MTGRRRNKLSDMVDVRDIIALALTEKLGLDGAWRDRSVHGKIMEEIPYRVSELKFDCWSLDHDYERVAEIAREIIRREDLRENGVLDGAGI